MIARHGLAIGLADSLNIFLCLGHRLELKPAYSDMADSQFL